MLRVHGKEVPIVIGMTAKPRCFNRISDKSMPHGIPYYSNPKACMTSKIMEDVLAKFNRKMVRQERNIFMFVDNVSSLSPSLVNKFSNINILFLPKNKTSRLQLRTRRRNLKKLKYFIKVLS